MGRHLTLLVLLSLDLVRCFCVRVRQGARHLGDLSLPVTRLPATPRPVTGGRHVRQERTPNATAPAAAAEAANAARTQSLEYTRTAPRGAERGRWGQPAPGTSAVQ